MQTQENSHNCRRSTLQVIELEVVFQCSTVDIVPSANFVAVKFSASPFVFIDTTTCGSYV